MLNFIIGSLYTIIILFIGAVIGYFIGAKELDRAVEKIRKKLQKTPVASGPVKAMSSSEKQAADDPERKKIQEIIGSAFR